MRDDSLHVNNIDLGLQPFSTQEKAAINKSANACNTLLAIDLGKRKKIILPPWDANIDEISQNTVN